MYAKELTSPLADEDRRKSVCHCNFSAASYPILLRGPSLTVVFPTVRDRAVLVSDVVVRAWWLHCCERVANDAGATRLIANVSIFTQ